MVWVFVHTFDTSTNTDEHKSGVCNESNKASWKVLQTFDSCRDWLIFIDSFVNLRLLDLIQLLVAGKTKGKANHWEADDEEEESRQERTEPPSADPRLAVLVDFEA